MYLLYLDDSGSTQNKTEKHLILAGLIIHESSMYHINDELEKLANKFNADRYPDFEFHASEIVAGKTDPWENMDTTARKSVVKSVLKIAAKECAFTGKSTILGVAVEKGLFKEDPMQIAFEEMASRFNKFINRKYHESCENGGTVEHDRGLIILDKSSDEKSLQKAAACYRKRGTRWKQTTDNMQEAPMFVDSKASSAIQIADHIAYALFRYYERQDCQYISEILHSIDKDAQTGLLHGLRHKTKTKDCMCYACLSRRLTNNKRDE